MPPNLKESHKVKVTFQGFSLRSPLMNTNFRVRVISSSSTLMGLPPFSSPGPSSTSAPNTVCEEELKVEGSMKECVGAGTSGPPGGAFNKKTDRSRTDPFNQLDCIDVANNEKGTSIVLQSRLAFGFWQLQRSSKQASSVRYSSLLARFGRYFGLEPYGYRLSSCVSCQGDVG